MLPFNLSAFLQQSQHPSVPNYSHSSHLAPVHLRSQAANQNESPFTLPGLCRNSRTVAYRPFHISPLPSSTKCYSHKSSPTGFLGLSTHFPINTHLRIVFQNCNTLSKDHFTRFSYLNRLKLLEPHIFGLVETNLNWSHFPTKTSVYSSLKACWSQLRVTTSPLEGAFPSCPSTQAGGCLQLTSGRTSGQVQRSLSDPMGRWCSQTLQGASNQLITIITAYGMADR
jgi:hypothetical protein